MCKYEKEIGHNNIDAELLEILIESINVVNVVEWDQKAVEGDEGEE